MIAAQTVAVAVLAAIIFLAFLRPADERDLSGIEAGDAPPRATSPRLGDSPRRDRGSERGGEPGQGPAISGSAGAGGESPPAGAPGPASGTGTGTGTGGGAAGGAGTDDETPSDSQYEDAVTRLLDRVGGDEPAPGS